MKKSVLKNIPWMRKINLSDMIILIAHRDCGSSLEVSDYLNMHKSYLCQRVAVLDDLYGGGLFDNTHCKTLSNKGIKIANELEKAINSISDTHKFVTKTKMRKKKIA